MTIPFIETTAPATAVQRYLNQVIIPLLNAGFAGAGTVTTVSFKNGNGFTGTILDAATTPQISLDFTTNIVGQDYIVASPHTLILKPIDLSKNVTGNLAITNIAGGVNANATTVLYGDGTWRVPPSGGSGATSGVGITVASDGSVNLNNTAVAAATYTYANGSLTVNSQGQITAAISAPAISIPDQAFFFGTGSDGDASITSTVTLTANMSYRNLTISGSGRLNTAGYKIYVSGILDISGAAAASISNYFSANPVNVNGGLGSTVTGGTGGIQAQNSYMGSGVSGTAGANGGAGAAGGGTAFSPGTLNGANGGSSGASGRGGQGGLPGFGGSGGSSTAAAVVAHPQPYTKYFDSMPVVGFSGGVTSPSSFFILAGGNGGPGGAGGGGPGSSTDSGGGGGGGGAGGPVLYICANIINKGSNSTARLIDARGGTGGKAGNPLNPVTGAVVGGGGGGAGGGGGWIWLAYGSLIGSAITNALDASGGTGGDGTGATNGGGTAACGAGGGGGNGGRITVINLAAGTCVDTIGAAGAAGGNPPGGSLGGAGGAGGTCQVSL